MLQVLITDSSAYAKRRSYHCKPFLSINIKLMVFQLLVIKYINYLLTFCKFEWRYSLQTLMVPSTWCSQENYKRTTSDVTNTKNRDNYSTTGVSITPHSQRVNICSRYQKAQCLLTMDCGYCSIVFDFKHKWIWHVSEGYEAQGAFTLLL